MQNDLKRLNLWDKVNKYNRMPNICPGCHVRKKACGLFLSVAYNEFRVKSSRDRV